MSGFDHLDPPRRYGVAMTGGRYSRETRWREAELVEIMPLRRGGHGCGGLAGGKTDHPAFRHRAQMRCQHHVGMRSRDGGVEDLAQERASVGHCFTRSGVMDESTGRRLSIRFRQKKTPAATLRGFSLER